MTLQGSTPLAFSGFEARSLTLARGNRRLFSRLGFSVKAGTLLVLLGPNGSGKSSLLRSLIGLAPLQAGELARLAPAQAVAPAALRAEVLYQGHSPAAKGELTALENLQLTAVLDDTVAHLDANGARLALRGALETVGLARQRDIETRRLSQGQRQRLHLARFALALQADVRALWLMDEPSAALDQAGADLLQALISRHLARGGAAIVATHLPIAPESGQRIELHLDAFQPVRQASAHTGEPA